MLVGYNQNIKYRGVTFHVQTEDNGTKNPLIITHVFVGGNIVASKKTSYGDILKIDNLEKVLRELMEEQHKNTIQEVMNGKYDDHPLVKDLLLPVEEPAVEKFEELNLDGGGSLDEVILDYLDEDDIERKD